VSQLPALKYRRVGHKGADLIAPGNTAASFDAALAAGVDMIEFDVLPEDHTDRDGSRLLLAHDYTHDLADAPTLEAGLAHLAATPFKDVELDVDLKLPGYEARVVDALRAAGLIERSLISSMYRESLALIRELEPALRLGWSVPKVQKDYTDVWWAKYPAYAMLIYARQVLPGRAAAAIFDGAVDALMAHWRLITRDLVEAIHGAGGELYVWTVDDPQQIARLEALGVTGIISNDPRLFAR
jgi:glycerophosphoryl diester phosphodiesterase